MDPAVTLQGIELTHAFGRGAVQTQALRRVSLSLRQGECALIMGPSGSGKSTLLAVLSGLLEPTGGRVVALGEDLWRLPESQRKEFRRRHCGYIFQGYNLFPALTARQHLEMVLRWGEGASTQEARSRASAVLEHLGMSSRSELRPAELSGGEQQRVAIGRALIKGPMLCFADEPTAALDWSHGRRVLELLRAMAHERGATVLVVAHDPRIVPFADRLFHLEDGVLSESRPATDFA